MRCGKSTKPHISKIHYFNKINEPSIYNSNGRAVKMSHNLTQVYIQPITVFFQNHQPSKTKRVRLFQKTEWSFRHSMIVLSNIICNGCNSHQRYHLHVLKLRQLNCSFVKVLSYKKHIYFPYSFACDAQINAANFVQQTKALSFYNMSAAALLRGIVFLCPPNRPHTVL